MQKSKRFSFYIYDICALSLVFPLALYIRLGSLTSDTYTLKEFYITYAILLIIKISTYLASNLPRSIWRYAGIYDLFYIIRFSLFTTFSGGTVLFLYNRLENIPRSSLIVDFLLTVTFLGGSRLLLRLFLEKEVSFSFRSKKKKGKRTIVIGGKLASKELIKVFKNDLKTRYNLIGLIDQDKSSHGRFIQGIKIFGDLDDLQDIIKTYLIESVFFVSEKSNTEINNRIKEICFENNLELKKLPLIRDIASGKVTISNIRPVKIEDILSRETIHLEKELIKDMLNNQVIMVTGGGGSIGSELCRQILVFSPRKLIIFDICELFIYNIENEMKLLLPNTEIIPVIGDVRDFSKISEIIEYHKPHVVLHAAAYKHVPLMERNPEEAFKTNLLGTYNVALASVQNKVARFVMISTDKAVNPTSIMGATKRIAEMICKNLQEESSTKFMTVRFGNVLGSNGSVIPHFLKQIERGGPVTVTHPEITRFFMTIPEASQLVLQSAAMGSGGEIFVLEMGKPVKILELAKDLIRLAGHEIDDIGIDFTGLRPGEKLYEEVLANEENTVKTFHPQVLVALTRELSIDFDQDIMRILENINTLDYYQEVRKLVPEYKSQF